MDVVIIGGGPGGLAAALALHKAAPQLKVAIYERCPALSRRGAGLGLDVNGQKALRAIEPAVHAELLKQAAFLTTQRVLSADGTLIKETALSAGRKEFEQQGYRTPCLLGWYEIQQMLLQALPQSTRLHLGVEFDHYEQEPSTGLLTVHFRGGQQPPVQAGLLVAADGYFSRVRRQAVGDGPPSYGKTVVWRARLPAASAVAAGLDLQGSSSAFVQDVGRFFFAYPISSGDYVWTVGVSDEKLAEQGIDPASLLEPLRSSKSNSTQQLAEQQQQQQSNQADNGQQQATATSANGSSAELDTQGYSAQDAGRGEAARARCLQALAGFSDTVLDIIGGTPGACLVEHGIYVRPAADMTPAAYGAGRVVVMGDAAHPLRPTGQGLNQAMEDAWGLGAALAAAAAVGQKQLEPLQAFRQQRAARMRTVVAYTTASGEAAYKRSMDKGQADKALGPDTAQMSSEEFFNFCYDVTFEDLAGLLSKQQQQPAAAV